MREFNNIQQSILRVLALLLFSGSSLHGYEIPPSEWSMKPGLHAPGFSDGIIVPLPFEAKKYPEQVDADATRLGFTLEKKFTLRKEDFGKLKGGEPELYITYISNVYTVFFNGKKVHLSGEMDESKVLVDGFNRNKRVPVNPGSLVLGENTVTIQVSGALNDEVSMSKPILLEEAVINQATNDDLFPMMLAGLYTFLGLYHLLLYSKRRQEDYNLWFGLFTIFLSMYIFTRSNLIFDLNLNLLWQKRWEWASIAFTTAFASMFFARYFRAPDTRFSWFLEKLAIVYIIFIAILQFTNLFLTNGPLGVTLQIWQASVLGVMLVIAISSIGRAIHHRNGDGWRMLSGILVMVVAAVWDIAGDNGWWGLVNLELSKYGFMIFVIGITFVLANRFLRIYNEAEELSGNLEKKVEERTEELNNTLKAVQKLKEQQDGDYFLTSLLLKPLGVTHIRNENVKIESFLKQKKDFSFRNREQDIGGDINVAHDIKLQNRDYVLFLNGDAMGKSIQGAGGALVLGTVFQSIVDRTHNSEREQSLYPERWLKNTFIEMHKVFSSFDGSMLMSIVMGLLDPANGTVYFINAEHPFTALYRDGKASFLEEDVPLRKLGTTIISTNVNVTVEKIEEGDAIVMGSDGRDDLLLGHDEDGNRIINEDETVFLEVFEQAKGDLPKCFEILKEKGGITDDTSILKVILEKKASPPIDAAAENSALQKAKDAGDPLPVLKEAIEQNPGSIRLINEYLAAASKGTKKDHYHRAAMAYFTVFPHDSEKLREVASKLVEMGEYNKALDFAERYRLRHPEHKANLESLIAIYENMGKEQLVADYKAKVSALS